jgi:hypothetical protein
MTDDLRALDEEIARARGWVRHDGLWTRDEWSPFGTFGPDVEWAHEIMAMVRGGRFLDCEDPRTAPPPFSSEWALAGPLLAESGDDPDVASASVELCEDGWDCVIQTGALGTFRTFDGTSATPCEAIARAWLAWARGKA